MTTTTTMAMTTAPDGQSRDAGRGLNIRLPAERPAPGLAGALSRFATLAPKWGDEDCSGLAGR